jgi:hypothetical protein
MRKRVEATVKDLEGFEYDKILDRYRCNVQGCTKTFVYDSTAVTHREKKHTSTPDTERVRVFDQMVEDQKVAKPDDLIGKVISALDEASDAIVELEAKALKWDQLANWLPSIEDVYKMLMEVKNASK